MLFHEAVHTLAETFDIEGRAASARKALAKLKVRAVLRPEDRKLPMARLANVTLDLASNEITADIVEPEGRLDSLKAQGRTTTRSYMKAIVDQVSRALAPSGFDNAVVQVLWGKKGGKTSAQLRVYFKDLIPRDPWGESMDEAQSAAAAFEANRKRAEMFAKAALAKIQKAKGRSDVHWGHHGSMGAAANLLQRALEHL